MMPRFRTFAIIALSIVLNFIFQTGKSRAQDDTAALTATEIMHKADSVSTLQDSLLAHTNYKVKEEFILNELSDKGIIKKSDTVISLVTLQGKEELSRETVYSTRNKKEKEEKEKKGRDDEAGFSFLIADPNYIYSLIETGDSSYIIAVSPKASPPQKGDIKGKITIDRQKFFTRSIDLEVPKPQGALREFATSMTFEPLEGGVLVMREMRMRGFDKALLGIFKMRFSGSIRYTDYQILDR